jgi:hypothetical protein
MTTAEEYRRNAAECIEALKTTTAPEVRAALLTMAQQWNERADQWERGAAQLSPKAKEVPSAK